MNDVNNKLREVVVGIIFCATAIYVLRTMMSSGGLFGAMKLAPVFAIVSLVIAIASQRYWIGILLAVQASVWSPPLPVFDRLGMNMLAVLLIIVAYIPTGILKRNKITGIHNHLRSLLMGGLLAIVIGWFVLDPPGSARMSTTGGLGEAFAILLGVIAYFFVPYIIAQGQDFRKNWHAYVAVVVVASMPSIFINIKRLANPSSLNIFNEVLWFFFPVVLCPVFAHYRAVRTRLTSFAFNAAIPLTMLAGVLSAQRSRPFYAIFMMLVIAHAYGLKKTLFKRLALLIVPGILFVTLFPQYIPSSAIRAMSTFLPAESARKLQRSHGVQGEMGWTADWRKNMTDLAWRDMRMHPFVGKGFSYSFDEIASAVWAQGGEFGAQSGLYQGLAVSGGYHNGLLTLAVFCGIPAALLFAAALLLTSRKFVAVLPGLNNVWLKYLAVSMMAAFVPYTFHMLINGSGPQIFRLCVLMGGMNGILWRLKKDPALSIKDFISNRTVSNETPKKPPGFSGARYRSGY
jgi:hypothetical protein